MKAIKMKENDTSGHLITFCGLDGCGKTTLINRLIKEFDFGEELLLTKEPTDAVRKSPIFRTYMDDPNHSAYDYRSLSLLAASDRIQHANKVILPAMEQGKVVISDRYFYSCLANLRARGYKKDKWIYEICRNIVRPDLAFFLDVPAEIAIARVRSREAEKDRYIDIGFQFKLRQEYIDICKRAGGVLVPTTCSEDECFDIIKKEVERRIKNVRRR